MRIISGSLKGKSINFVRNSTTRPLKDSVKENIFNILSHSNSINTRIEQSNILDLYSGIGSFGLECISRGAKKVTFIEKDKNTLKVLNKNVINFSITNQVIIINDKIENFFKKSIKEKYNIFFFDPPFRDKTFVKKLNFIKNNRIYEKKHIVIIHREKETNDFLDKSIDTIIEKKYGRSRIIFGTFN